MELRQEARERQAGELYARLRDRAIQTTRPGDEPEPQPLTCRFEELANLYAQYLSSSSRIVW